MTFLFCSPPPPRPIPPPVPRAATTALAGRRVPPRMGLQMAGASRCIGKSPSMRSGFARARASSPPESTTKLSIPFSYQFDPTAVASFSSASPSTSSHAFQMPSFDLAHTQHDVRHPPRIFKVGHPSSIRTLKNTRKQCSSKEVAKSWGHLDSRLGMAPQDARAAHWEGGGFRQQTHQRRITPSICRSGS